MVKPIPENNGDTAKNVIMLSMGIDVSKGESMVCALNQFGKVVLTPRRYKHVKSALGSLVERLRSFGDNDIRIIMETTGIYSLPVAKYFKEQVFLGLLSILMP